MHTGDRHVVSVQEAAEQVGGEPISVVLVEDHPHFRDALASAIATTADIFLAAVCRDLPSALDCVEQSCPQVLLVDLGLPTGSGMVLLKCVPIWWGARCTSAVLTMTGDEEHLLKAATAGAKGCLFKSDQPQDWLTAIRALAHGQGTMHAKLAQYLLQLSEPGAQGVQVPEGREAAPVYTWDALQREVLLLVAAGYTPAETAARLRLSEDEVGRRLRGVYDQLHRPGPNLSRRELQLLRLLNQGLTFKQCAEVMRVSESTTKTQSARAYEKLGANNLQMALHEARQAGYLY